MAKSQNGWAASPSLETRVIKPVKGVSFRIVDNPDVATVFMYLIQQFHKRVEDITDQKQHDDWGFAYRANRNSPNDLSNHSSGTAVDLDATEHPNGVPTGRTFTNKQISEIHKILHELGGVVRWGGDYTHTIDAMHFEINASAKHVKAVANKLRGTTVTKAVKTVEQIAAEVINGKWGDGDTRVMKLKAAGYDPAKVQAAVEKQLKK